jgi:hypothetical protein
MQKIIVVVLCSMLWYSCTNRTEKTTSHEATESHAGHDHDEDGESIALNHGEKWVVTEAMKPFVQKGSELVTEYIKTEQTDYKALAQALADQNSQLIKSCTMEGKSHDELHKWLHPHLELVKTLENATEATEADAIVMELQDSYVLYHQYFN